MKNICMFLIAVIATGVLQAQETAVQARLHLEKETYHSFWDSGWLWLTIAAIIILGMVLIGRVVDQREF